MKNTDQVRENADAARRFEPLKQAEIHQLRDAFLAFGPTLCADCDGRCSVAAGTTGRARQPDPVPDLPRAPRRPRHGPPPVRRALRRRPATGPVPTSKPPRPPAPTSSTSPSSCPRSSGTWPELSGQWSVVVDSGDHGTQPFVSRLTIDIDSRLDHDPNQPTHRDRRKRDRARVHSRVGAGRPERQQGVDGRPAAVRRPRLGLAAARRPRPADSPGGQDESATTAS